MIGKKKRGIIAKVNTGALKVTERPLYNPGDSRLY
jgi:hypothetical protein